VILEGAGTLRVRMPSDAMAGDYRCGSDRMIAAAHKLNQLVNDSDPEACPLTA
jgi:hypothetical protein